MISSTQESIFQYLQSQKKYQPWKELLSNAIFTFENSLGSKIYTQKIDSQHCGKYLNLGCGTDKFDGWINADLYKFYRILRGWDDWPDWMLDATKPWNCPNNFWAGIYSEHAIEHIRYLGVIKLFKECYRTLRPGKYLRVVVPDLSKYIQYYNGELANEHFNQFSYSAEAFSDLTQNWGHVSVWDETLLANLLNEIGFIKVAKVDFQVGSDHLLLKDKLERQWESLYVEAQKPFK